jgi:hypothetical protein
MVNALRIMTLESAYWWPTKCEIPDPVQPGKVIVSSFLVRFAAPNEPLAREVAARITAYPKLEERLEHLHDYLLEAVTDWREVNDAEGAPVPFFRGILHRAIYAEP